MLFRNLSSLSCVLMSKLSEDLVHMGTSDPAFKKILKIIFLSFKKSENKYLDIANYLSHKRAKDHVQMFCILVYTKKTNV
jgi:hypothetical protein